MRAMPDDKSMMALALVEARAAAAHDDVPIGCVISRGDEVVARAHNARERDQDPTAHAEVLALRAAARALGSWRLDGCTVYVTLEPCVMCAGAMVLARVERLVYAAPDPKAGAVRSLYNIADDARLNHRIAVTGGVLEEEAAEQLRAYFSAKRP
jgi:tRNA(adenine34) deaminase